MKKRSCFSVLLLILVLVLSTACRESSLKVSTRPDIPVINHSPGDSGYIPVIPPSAFPLLPIVSHSSKENPTLSKEPLVSYSSPDSFPSLVSPALSPDDPSDPFSVSSPDEPIVVVPALGLSSPHAFVYSVERKGFLLLAGNDRIIYPASTTKLLTILYARTLLPADLVVMPGNELELVGANSSVAYIKNHHRLTVEQLIEGMLLPSGNDAAYVLAAAGGRMLKPDAVDGKEAVTVFMEGMNRYAADIGLVGSHFVNPDGYQHPDHWSTLEDMALVAALAYEDPMIRKYAELPKDDVVYASGHTNTWVNTNLCLDPQSPYYLPEANGLKTGSISKDYSCLIISYELEGQSFIAGLFGAPQREARFTDAALVLSWIKNYVIA